LAVGVAALFALLIGGSLLATSLVVRIEQAKDERIVPNQRYVAAIDDVALGAQTMATHEAAFLADGRLTHLTAIAAGSTEVEEALGTALAVFATDTPEELAARRVYGSYRRWAAALDIELAVADVDRPRPRAARRSRPRRADGCSISRSGGPASRPNAGSRRAAAPSTGSSTTPSGSSSARWSRWCWSAAA
jgi:hypothetical protein